MKRLLHEMAGYGIASAVALCIDMSVLWLLVTRGGWSYLPATTASFIVGAAAAYEISVKLVFSHRRLRDRRTEFATFVALGTLGLGVNALIMWLAVGKMGLQILVAKSLAACCTFGCNFFVRRQILFVRSSAR